MKKSKLIRVLITFSKNEFKDFEKFVASPYFGRGRDLVPLLKVLKKFYPEFSSKKFTRENLISKLTNKSRIATDSLLKMQMSELYKMAVEFLQDRGFRSRKGLKEYFIINQFRRRGLIDQGETRAEREINSIIKSGIDRWYYMYYLFSGSEKVNLAFSKDNPGSVFSYMNNVTEMAVHQFLCLAARFLFNLNAVKTFYNQPVESNLLVDFFQNPVMEELFEKLESKTDNVSIAGRIYLLSILTDVKPEKEDIYFMFSRSVLDNIEIFTVPERFFLLHSLIVKAVYYMDTRDYSKYAEEAFRIINFRLDKNLHKESPDGFYTSVEFFVSLKIGFVLNQKKWIRDYTARHIAEVPGEHRKETQQLSEAFLKFAQKDYSGSLELASQVAGLPFVLIYELKCLQLMAAYELNMPNEAFYMLEAFKVYLNKNKNVSAYFRQSNLNFIKYYTLITKYRLNEINSDLQWIKIEIENSNAGYKNWLIEKIVEFFP